jgi:hypothetical protein
MSWPEFIVEMVKATAWPAVVLVSLLTFKEPIASLIPHLSKLKYKDLEIEFENGVARLRESADRVFPVDRKRSAPPLEFLVAPLAVKNPKRAVLDAWSHVDSAARAAISRSKSPQSVRPDLSSSRVVADLQAAGVVTPEGAGLINDLYALRNQAAHVPDDALSPQAARDYVLLAAQMTEYLDSWKAPGA